MNYSNTVKKAAGFAFAALMVVAFIAVAAPTVHAYDGFGDCCSSGYTFEGGGGYSYEPSGYTFEPSSGYSYTPSYDSYYTPSYDAYYTPSYDSYYNPSYDAYYTPSYDSYYSESPVYYGSDGAMYSSTGGGYSSGGGYSTGGGYPFSFGTRTIGYPVGTPAPSRPTASTPSSQTQSQSSTNINENTSNSVSSVSNSGNSNNVNNINVVVNVPQQAPVTPVYTLPTVQYPVQFVQPIQTPSPYCTISITNNGGYNNVYSQATLTWSASNATSAYISPNVGTVSTYGTRIVNPIGNQVFTMTVYGQNGQTATCQTTFYAPVVPTTPYVSLSQIPYTGFDLGQTGTAIYWASLVAFALAAAYLMIYFRGGALAVAGNMLSTRGTVNTEEKVVAPVAAPVKAVVAPASFDLPVTSSRHVTTDTMTLTPDGRLVINRS